MQGSQNSNGQETVLEKSYDGSTGWAFQVNSTSGHLGFEIGEGNNSFAQVLSNVNLLDGNFHYVTGTWDGGTKMSLYVDGISQGTATLTATPANNAGGLNIGFSSGTGVPSQYFQGAVDNVQILRLPLPAGAYGYIPASDTVLSAGDGQTLSVTFTPNDTTDPGAVTASVKLNVKKATPVVTWATPAPITYGTALRSSGAKTSYDLTNTRWSTNVAKGAATGNTFTTGVAFQVPIDFPSGIQSDLGGFVLYGHPGNYIAMAVERGRLHVVPLQYVGLSDLSGLRDEHEL